MTKRKVTLIPGDGVGPSLVDAAVAVLEAAGAQIEWDRQAAGADVMEKYGTPCRKRSWTTSGRTGSPTRGR